MTEKPEIESTSVPETAKQVEEVRARWAWTEPTIWTARMLTTLEEGIKGGKWYSLGDKAFSVRSLRACFAKVKANKGAAGVDGVTVEAFERSLDEELERLSLSLMAGSYRPQAVKRVLIPKPGSREKRPLGIPTVRDRVVQTAVRRALEPIFEREFVDTSYGFRPGRSCGKALRSVWLGLKSGATHVVDADLKRFFDTIPHSEIMSGVEAKVSDGRILGVLWQFLKQGVMTFGSDLEEEPEEGTPQGSPLSPLLANIALHGLDVEAQSAGYRLVRYADDFVILCGSSEEAESALEMVRTWTHSSGLELHPEKTRIVNHSSGETFVFLGYKFKGHRVYPSDKSTKRFHDKTRKHTARNSGSSLAVIIRKLNPVLRGWYRYFRHSGPRSFGPMDSYVRNRLRSILSARRGVRRVAKGRDFHRWPNAYFMEQGLFSMEQAHAKKSAPLRANH
jgi:RNA-directed DNA polymerase